MVTNEGGKGEILILSPKSHGLHIGLNNATGDRCRKHWTPTHLLLSTEQTVLTEFLSCQCSTN